MPEDQGIVLPFLAAVTGAAANGFVAAGELWDWARPHLTAAGLQALVWLRESDRA